MSSSPSPSSSATSPSSSAASPPPLPSLSPPSISKPPPPSSPPPVPSAPAPASPPPASPPPASPPRSPPSTPSADSPPPVLTSPPPPSPPRPVASPPPVPVVPPPPTAASSPPPISEPPPAPAAPSPPPLVSPPPPTDILGSPPPPIPASPPPPDPVSPPPPNEASPSPPSVPSSPRTPNAPPPSPPSPRTPTRTSPPMDPPSRPPHPRSPNPPSVPSATPPKSPFTPLSPPSPPIDSNDTSPAPFQTSPPLPPPTITPGSSINTTGPSSSNSPTPVSNTSTGNSPGGGGLKTSSAVPVGLVVVFVVLGSLGLAVWFLRRRKKSGAGYISGFVMPSPYTSSATSESPHQRSPAAPLVHHKKSGSVASEGGIVGAQLFFSYKELYEITNGFSPQNILGEGGFGCVYKGCLPDGRQVAVKQLKVGSGQGEREFKSEVEIISRVHHRHLVSLVGYCISESQRLLVYDFVPNDNLHSHLHGKGKPVVDWPTRVKVAAGAARGIAYLHEDCHPRIIHRDIKSSNILLDNNFEAQVSDFGLARLAMDAKTHVTTRVIGTFGYLAPEYASSGKVTDRSDVYSFGVVLLELITGRRPVDDTQPMGEESLVEWARPRLAVALETRDFGELLDPKLENNYSENEMFRMIEAAAACIRHSAAMRPQMGKVVRALDALADVDLNNGVKPGQSELFNVVESADIRLFQRMAFGSQVFRPEYSHSNWSTQSDP